MKKHAKASGSSPQVLLGKALFEAGLQCPKRLYLDAHEPGAAADLSENRRVLAEAGRRLAEIAGSAFGKTTRIEGKTPEESDKATRDLLGLENSMAVVLGATFVHDGMVALCDILLRQKDGKVDLFEVKSGTSLKPRYIFDLALQVHVIEAAGFRVRAAHVLHINSRYAHAGGEEYPAHSLFKSIDVTERVRARVTKAANRMKTLRTLVQDESALQLPMGTYCTVPFPCPHMGRCAKEAPPMPLRLLPELSRTQENLLHQEGIDDLQTIDPLRSGLSFRQRRTLQCVQKNEPIAEPFLREELRNLQWPLHFLAVHSTTEVLPAYAGQHPWRQVPYAYALTTLHETGRVERHAFVHSERSDPRELFAAHLAKGLAPGGSLILWGDTRLTALRAMLEDLPESKAPVRAVLGRPLFDLSKLFEVGLFHPQLLHDRSLPAMARVLLGDTKGTELAIHDADELLAATHKMIAPRIRSATREKLAADILARLQWQTETMLELYRKHLAEEKPAVKAPATKPASTMGPRKKLPKEPAPES